LDFFFEYLLNSIVGFSLELLAVIAGIYYLVREPIIKRRDKYLVYFLLFNFFLEIFASYAPIGFFSNFKYFSFVKNTPFENNVWLYNIYLLINFSFFSYYFRSFLQNIKTRMVLKNLIFLFIILGTINLLYTDVFFKDYSLFSTVVGSLLVLIAVVLFYFNILKSDEIINLKKLLPIYISIGVLVFNLCVTPLDIFSKYFNEENGLFITFKTSILVFASVFMYSAFITGFIVCAKSDSNKEELLN